MRCKNKEKFALYYISYLLGFDFKKKSFKYNFIPIYLFGPQTATISLISLTSTLFNAVIIFQSTTTFVLSPIYVTGLESALFMLLLAFFISSSKISVGIYLLPIPAPVYAFTILPFTTTFVLLPVPAPRTKLIFVIHI